MTVSDATTLVRALFGTPGSPLTNGQALLDRAASAHAALLDRAGSDGGAALGRSLAPLREYLGRHTAPADRRRLLCHPLLIEGLHALAPLSPELRRWHDAVIAVPPSSPASPPAESAAASLGNVTLVLLLR